MDVVRSISFSGNTPSQFIQNQQLPVYELPTLNAQQQTFTTPTPTPIQAKTTSPLLIPIPPVQQDNNDNVAPKQLPITPRQGSRKRQHLTPPEKSSSQNKKQRATSENSKRNSDETDKGTMDQPIYTDSDMEIINYITNTTDEEDQYLLQYYNLQKSTDSRNIISAILNSAPSLTAIKEILTEYHNKLKSEEKTNKSKALKKKEKTQAKLPFEPNLENQHKKKK